MQIPIFPLKAVLFPGASLALRVFETRYVDMTRDCLKHDKPFGVCLIREGREVGAPAVPERIGCLARIADCDMQQLGVLELRVTGQERFRLVTTHAGAQGLVIGDAQPLPAEPDTPVPARFQSCVEFLRRALDARGGGLFAGPYHYENAVWVGYRLAEILPLPLPDKQRLLEAEDALSRLHIVQEALRLRAAPES